jgi:hypothetical protein
MPDALQAALDRMPAFGFEPYGSDGKSRLGRKGDSRCLLIYEHDLPVSKHDDRWIVHGPGEYRYGGHTAGDLPRCLVHRERRFRPA